MERRTGSMNPVKIFKGTWESALSRLERPMQCGHCGKIWDDGVVTTLTLVPSGRCPFESDHKYNEDDPCCAELCDECIDRENMSWLRSLTAKPPRNATQREKNIYEAATRLLANLENKHDGTDNKC